MSDEEDDYMSDAVLASCGDVRPGLYKGTKEMNKRVQEKKAETSQKNRLKPLKVREAEKRDEALKTSLNSSNKGFALLQKMGYKPGTAIGKSGEGRLEPIGIELKSNRGGLGQEAEKRRRDEEKRHEMERRYEKRIKAAQALQSSYRDTKISEQRQKRTEKHLRDSQKVCEQLDESNSVEAPIKLFYWPKDLLPSDPADKSETADTEEADTEEAELVEDDIPSPAEIMEQLEDLTGYLRSTYFYCIWCGYAFDDLDHLATDCPGETADDHDQ